MKPMLSQRARSLITGVCRLVLAVVFIVSGFTKVIDPWGTSIKINEYLTIYGFDYLIPASMVFFDLAVRRRDDDGLHAALQGAYPAGVDLRSGVDAFLYDPYLFECDVHPGRGLRLFR